MKRYCVHFVNATYARTNQQPDGVMRYIVSYYDSDSAPISDILTGPEVHTKLGSLRGQYVSVKGKESGVHAYLGVPFAKPPVGPALRLAPPQPVEGWEGVRDATQQPPM